jgi:hypothetical protein
MTTDILDTIPTCPMCGGILREHHERDHPEAWVYVCACGHWQEESVRLSWRTDGRSGPLVAEVDRLRAELSAARAVAAILERQASPVPGHDDVWEEVIADLVARDVPASLIRRCRDRRAIGIARYGQPLSRDDGRDHRRDLDEELLDAAAYAWALGQTDVSRVLLGWVTVWG